MRRTPFTPGDNSSGMTRFTPARPLPQLGAHLPRADADAAPDAPLPPGDARHMVPEFLISSARRLVWRLAGSSRRSGRPLINPRCVLACQVSVWAEQIPHPTAPDFLLIIEESFA